MLEFQVTGAPTVDIECHYDPVWKQELHRAPRSRLNIALRMRSLHSRKLSTYSILLSLSARSVFRASLQNQAEFIGAFS